MSDEQGKQVAETPAEPERDGSGFRKDGVIEYGIDGDGFLHVDGTQIEKVAEEPGEQIPGQIQIGGRNYTQDELEAAIQRATEAEAKIAEAERLRETLAPFEPIISSERFNDLLEELAEEGVGPAFPVPQPEDTSGVSERWEREGSWDVHQDVVAHAQTLPEVMQRAIDTNPKLYNELFDRIEAARKESLKGRQSYKAVIRQAEKPRQEVIDAILKSKEVSKGRAAVERPGVSPPPDAGLNRSRKEMERIVAYAKQGDEEAQLKWAEMLMEKPKKGTPESGF